MRTLMKTMAVPSKSATNLVPQKAHTTIARQMTMLSGNHMQTTLYVSEIHDSLR